MQPNTSLEPTSTQLNQATWQIQLTQVMWHTPCLATNQIPISCLDVSYNYLTAHILLVWLLSQNQLNANWLAKVQHLIYSTTKLDALGW